jgi:hypothetical protein
MTFENFKSWLEGFMENVSPDQDGLTGEQWSRVQDQLSKVVAPVQYITREIQVPAPQWPWNQHQVYCGQPLTMGHGQVQSDVNKPFLSAFTMAEKEFKASHVQS